MRKTVESRESRVNSARRAIFYFLFSIFALASLAFGQVSGAGQLGCSGSPITGTAWTSSTSQGTTQAVVTNSPGANVLVQLDQTSTITAGAITFQGSADNTNWVSVPVAQVLNPAGYAQLTNPYTLVASTNQPFLITMNGFVSIRLNLSTAISGTGSVTPYITPNCNQQTAAILGNVTVIGAGSAGSANSGVETIQGIASMTPVQVSQATASNLNATVSQSTASNLQATVTPASSTTWAATQSGTWTVQPGNTANTTAWLVTTGDPCQSNSKTLANINLATTTATAIVTGTSSKQTYICAINIVAGAAVNVALIEGTTSTCGTGTAGMAGGTTAATGWNFAANGGLTYGNGLGTVLRTATAADNVCVVASASSQLSGSVMYVQQ